jgi:hypothetical protein
VLVTKLYLAALERQDTREEDRQDFELYIDEFQNFSTDIFPSILSEARKYRLCLTLAHQYLHQLSESVKHSVFGNVGTLVSFRVGSIDAKDLVEEFKPDFSSGDLEHAENYHAYIKLMIDGKRSNPFSMETLPPFCLCGDEAKKDALIRTSRRHYSMRGAEISDNIEKWFSK